MTKLLRFLAVVLAGLACTGQALANQCATPSRSGSAAALSGIINTYQPGTANVAAGATSISVGAATGAPTPIASGDLLLIIQMQDATIDTTNTTSYGTAAVNRSGRYEYVRAASGVSLAGGTVSIVGENGGGTLNAYTNANYGTTGQRRFQVIRVPQYADVTLGGTLTATRWNGTTGGVLVIDVAGTLDFAGQALDVTGRGFRGGGGRQLGGGAGVNTDYRTLASVTTNGSKGEGIGGTPRFLNDNGSLLDAGVEGYVNGSYARGAAATGGGGGTDGQPSANDQNTGGGGGANFGSGGQGGHAWCSSAPIGCPQTGGIGGRAITTLALNRLTLGGGGGAGTTNNGTGSPGAGFASSGAAGGGIVMVRTDRLRGSGTIRANGAAANATVGNDASGGGGAGGAVMVSALDGTGSALSVSAVGGNGGTNTPGGTLAHGPGGGGGGGFVATNFAVPSNTSGGAPGITENGGTFGASYGSTSGNGGSVLSPFSPSNIPGTSSSAECTPVIVKAFAPATIGVGQTARLSVTVRNRNPTLAMTAVAFTDTYPTQITNALVPNSATACGGTVTTAASGPNVALAGGSLAAASSCIIAVDVIGKAAGEWTNTIAAGGLTVAYGTQTTSSLSPTSAILKVAAPLSATKSNVAYWDPYNLFANPKAIPGSIVTYTITVTNPSGSATDPDSVTVSDMIPVDTKLIVTDFSVAGSGPVAFVDGAPPSGLAYAFGGLASTTDGLQFSTQASPSQTDPTHWAYVPSAGAGGIDPGVTYIRVKLSGTFAASGSFSVQFRARVR